MRAVAARYGADRTVAFGDNVNDLPMMLAADHAVAVANALQEVKRGRRRSDRNQCVSGMPWRIILQVCGVPQEEASR